MTAIAGLLALAVLELDAVLVAQTLASRPLVVGILLGALQGRALAGAMFGAVFELLGLCDLPVGGRLPWSAPVAAGTATVLAVGGTSFPLCFAGGVAAGALHSRAEAFERKRRSASGDALAERAAAGGRALGLALGASVIAHAAMTFALAGSVAVLTAFLDRRCWMDAPELLRAGAALAASSAPWIGLSGVAVWGLRRA
ncbi:MAG: hypothetical protein HY403_01450 [Elusimicrobia bacterium]|nr:hypothetical protein [Elusimicrobiota bacterium]